MLSILDKLKHDAHILPIDYHIAKLIAHSPSGDARADNLAMLLGAQLSFDLRLGSVCLNPADFERRPFFDLTDPQFSPYLADIQQAIHNTPPQAWHEVLQHHPALSQNQPAPLIFAHGMLYFYRTFCDEQQIARQIVARIRAPLPQSDVAHSKRFLARLFQPRDEIDWQKIAVAMALRSRFCLITGGPGTGKTTTVCKLLLALQYQQREHGLPALKVAMAAPTGKAAARLSESVRHNLKSNAERCHEPTLAQAIDCQAQTLHRMLGISLQDDKVRFHQHNPLLADVVVVDEVSMVDLNWFARLLNAVHPDARVILLGDEHQLASVESGAVLAQLSLGRDVFSTEFAHYLAAITGEKLPSRAQGRILRDNVCHLQKSHRFAENSGIKALADAVNAGARNSWALFAQFNDLHCVDYVREPGKALRAVVRQACRDYGEYINAIEQHQQVRFGEISAIFAAFYRVRYCCALRSGEFGVEYLNRAVSEQLKREGKLHFIQRDEWYHGKPVMITENDSAIGLYNGDVGLCLRNENGQLKVWFEKGQGEFVAFSPSRIPAFEPTFMMTVHKSQGSEFEKTVLVLPPTMAPLVTRELLYTAITRAKETFSVFGSKIVWEAGVRQPVSRRSGLYRSITAL
ncbi:exodeoxyribonuclease V subunit alpha [Pasteurellaceae bacterium HPA106]|uniref:exodeoxyribonuclease V subunit alpha n=1 Tax=Spirabiliibacterium pneumoniae TaxID=221400 RepID=UPI001AAC7DE5|nr:exodeoxyribonuclease V subunit alpha [Spirabiliibacterium pneumoniae]MBE2897113.1 exodeoxyribonuclease V subunit alpha [Spirabiliibacterium pneumoniae]